MNLSDQLESERQVLWRTQAELDTLKQQHDYVDTRAVEVTVYLMIHALQILPLSSYTLQEINSMTSDF